MSFPTHPHVLSTIDPTPQVTVINPLAPTERGSLFFTSTDELTQLREVLNDEIIAHGLTRQKLDLEQQLRANIESKLHSEQAKTGEVEKAYAACHEELQRALAANTRMQRQVKLENRNRKLQPVSTHQSRKLEGLEY
jgi:hypothetical protein